MTDFSAVPEIPFESMFLNTRYDRPDLKRRREVLRETVQRLKAEYESLHEQAMINLKRWSVQSEINKEDGASCTIAVYPGDWGEVTHLLTKVYGKCFAVLNMANAYVPGGAYIEGTIAQEENMFRRTDCHFSIRKEYLRNDRFYKEEWINLISGVNGKVYLDTQNLRICLRRNEVRDRHDLGYEWLPKEEIFPFYEMRSAAVDLRSGEPFNHEECKKRITAQFETLVNAGVRHVVLGAHGCGAFLNPSEKVADIYAEEIKRYKQHFENIAFAIYSSGYGPDNFTPFAERMKDL